MRLYREMRAAQLASRFTATEFGFRFAGNPYYLTPQWEPHEKRILSQCLAKADLFIDVGANHGFYSCLADSLGVAVAAVEPESGNLRYLKSNVLENDLEIEIFPVAVTSRAGVMSLFGDSDTASLVPGWTGYSTHFRQMVPTNTLDNLFADRDGALLIKVDVEGAEGDVLAGALGLIKRGATWLIETFPESFGDRPSPFRDVFQTMLDAGYSAYVADDKLTEVSPSMIRAWADDPLLAGRGGSNFLFRREA